MTPRPLRHSVAWALVGNSAYAACQWALLIAIAKLGSPTDVGRFALALALTGPVMMFAGLHLRAVQATDATGSFEFGSYLGLRLVTTAAALAIIGLTAWASASPDTFLLIAAVAVAKASESLSDVCYGRLQHDERQRRIALSMALRGAIGVGALVGTLASGGRLIVGVGGMAIGWLACVLLFDLPGVARTTSLRPRFDSATLRPLFWLALPMGTVMALGTLTVNVPRYALEAHRGTAALGHFAAIAYLFVAAMQPMLAVGTAISPRLARSYRQDLAAYRRLVRQTVQVAATLGVCLVAAVTAGGAPILARVYAPEYAVHVRAFEWTAVATAIGFVASALGYAVTAARQFHAQLVTAAVALGTCMLAAAVLVPPYGLVGAAWAMGCTEAVRCLCGVAVYTGVVGRRRAATLGPLAAEVPGVG